MERIVCASELPLCVCCQEPWCPIHQDHYADCPCIGPHNAEELGYAVVERNGQLWGIPMTYEQLRHCWPNASVDFLVKNADLPAHAPLPDPQQRQRPEQLAGGGEGETQGPGLRHCCFTLVRKKLLDVDAKYASIKDLLDCLTIAGIIRGDKEGQITLEVNQSKTRKGEAERTEIAVYGN